MSVGDRSIRLGTTGLLAAAVAKSVVALQASRWFDVDPLRMPGAFEGLDAAGTLAIDALLLASASAVLIGRLLSGRGLDVLAILLAAVPIPVLWWHVQGDLEQIWRGTSLAAIWFAFVAAIHLRDRPVDRALLAAGLLAAAVPWLARGAEQWFVDHPMTVAHFEANRAEVLSAMGWTEEGEAARIYERRLRQREMNGWFDLANVWSAAIAACAVAWTRLAAMTRGRSIEGGTVAVAVAIGLACIVGVLANGSKGAVAAMVAGVAFAWFAPRAASPSRLALAAVPLGLLAIVLRGLLPEDLLGDRSLLFRWHYLQGAWSSVLSDPLGVGPAGFQEQYLLLKPERSPEVVQSAHSMLPDAFVAVGVAAIAWAALLGRGLWRGEDSEDPQADVPAVRPRPLPSLLLVLVVAIVAAAVAAPTSIDIESIGRWIGIVAMPIAGVAAFSILVAMPAVLVSGVVAAAAFTLLLQGQIETTFFNQGASAWAMLAVGLAAGLGSPKPQVPPRRPAARWVLASIPAALAVAVLLGPLPAVRRVERGFSTAAAPLSAAGETILAGDSVAPETIVSARLEAAERLERIAVEGGPGAARAASLAIEQRIEVAMLAPDSQLRRDNARRAVDLSDETLERHGESAQRLSDRLRALRALRASDADAVPPRRIVDAIVAALTRQPQDVMLHIDLGDALAEDGDPDGARRAWRRGLELDAALELDPLVRLRDSQRIEIESKLSESP